MIKVRLKNLWKITDIFLYFLIKNIKCHILSHTTTYRKIVLNQSHNSTSKTRHVNTTHLGDRMLAKNILLLEPSGIRTTRQSPLMISTTCIFTMKWYSTCMGEHMHQCKGVDCSTISHTMYTMYYRPQYGWHSVNWSFIIVLCCI